jgi:hypothetical protein
VKEPNSGARNIDSLEEGKYEGTSIIFELVQQDSLHSRRYTHLTHAEGE